MDILKISCLIVATFIILQSPIHSSDMTKKKAFETLGIPENSSGDDIKKAYRKLSLQFHPDKLKGKPEKEQKEGEEFFKKINIAYKLLTATPDAGPSQEDLEKQGKEAISNAESWVIEHTNDFKDHEWIGDKRVERNNKGLATYIQKFFKSPDMQFNFPGPEGVWDYIVAENIAKIQTPLARPHLWNKETLKQEILKLAEQIKTGANSQQQEQERMRQEEARREAEEQERIRQEEADRLNRERQARQDQAHQWFNKNRSSITDDINNLPLLTEQLEEWLFENQEDFEKFLDKNNIQPLDQSIDTDTVIMLINDLITQIYNQKKSAPQHPQAKKLVLQALELAACL